MGFRPLMRVWSHLENLSFIGYVWSGKAGLSTMLTHEEKRELLGIAREVIHLRLDKNRPQKDAHFQGDLQKQRGAFVTIRVDHQLRGCIGCLDTTRPLAEVVVEVAPKAAFEDPRFPPLSVIELEQATIEISVLSSLQAIQTIDEIEVGIHGLVIAVGPNRGLLLPQVAREYSWDRESFLGAVSRKAGLHPLAWQDPEAKLYVFTAEVFDETGVMHGHEGGAS